MSDRRLKILILGGYGVFGGRLARLLAENPHLTLIIAGRSADKARRFAAGLPAGAERLAAAIDRDGRLEQVIADAAPDVVVDATGPFQSYGPDPYRVVRATIAAGANYLDLADGADFVEAIETFHDAAIAKGVFVLSGVSSFPVLTAAVLRRLTLGLDRIDSVTAGIAPSPFAGVGRNVIRAIVGYAGRPIRLVRDGAEATAFALTETQRYTIAPPGYLPLRNLRFSLVEVPDLLLIPHAMPAIRSIWVGAGPVPEILHRALNGLAWLVRLRLLPTLSPLASLCYWAINIFRWGEHRGGMFVEIVGADAAGNSVRRSWHMLAEGDDGPFIPSMATAAIILKMLAGVSPAPGARAATEALELTDYDVAFAGRAIVTGQRDDSSNSRLPLYQRLLGSAWDELPQSVRNMHTLERELTVRGVADVQNGTSLLPRLLRRLMGFPRAGKDVPLTVNFEARDGIERWQRSFADESFVSTQAEGRGLDDRLLVEHFGPTSVSLGLVAGDGKLRLILRRWAIFGMPLPLFLAPRSQTYEFEEDGRFHFHVELSHPLAGLIVKYTGWLECPTLA